MEKWADYLISGIWNNTQGVITNVMLHKDNISSVGNGVKKTRDQVIELIMSGNTVETITWNYNHGNWLRGSRVIVERVNNVNYIKTVRDSRMADNLDNSFPYGNNSY